MLKPTVGGLGLKHGSMTRALLCVVVACAMSVGCGEDAGKGDGAGSGGSSGAGGGGAEDGSVSGAACDLSGTWLAQHNTRNTALGAPQLAVNWNYHRIEQEGDAFTIVQSFDCGYVVRGTTDVSLSDATLEATARMASAAVGTEGTFAETINGEACDLSFDRIYAIRGANKAMFLDAVWSVGDAPKPLDEFAMPTNAAEGMEDWDQDGHEGLTQLTGIGDRYTAQIDWHAFHGQVPAYRAQFGGMGVITVDYDMREVVSEETPALLRTSSVPDPPGYGFMARIDEAVDEEDPLAVCRRVQALAVEKFGNPPSP